MREKVTICETGPRDGLQMAKSTMATPAKIAWIGAMVDAGIREIEVGSFVPPSRMPQMADTGEVVKASLQLPGLKVMALAPNLRGAMDAYAAGAHRIGIPVSVSEGHSLSNTNKMPMDQVAEVQRIVTWVRAQPRQMEVHAGCATAFGCSIDGVISEKQVIAIATALVATGADDIGLADTVGYGHPAQIKRMVRAVRAEVGDKLKLLHLHDTMGLGIANAFAGLEEGIRSFDSALAGLGGCPFAPGASGNIVTEDVVFMLESVGFDTGIDLDRLIAARAKLHEGLPAEPMHGQAAKAGVPRTYRLAA